MNPRTEPRQRSTGQALLLILILSLPLSCATGGLRQHQAPQENQAFGPIGYSGMARHGPASYLVVHDTKAHKDGPRLGLLEVTADAGTRYSPLAVTDWKDPDGRSSDLESACALPGRTGEFLVAESGSWKGKYGRVFHVRLVGDSVEVLQAYKLPLLVTSNEEQEGDNYEGMACSAVGKDRILVILGERGGTKLYPRGLLRWGILDPSRGSLDWQHGGEASIQVTSPRHWPAGTEPRDIADLHASPDGTLWAVAAADAGDNGPFRSVIYELGRITGGELPVEVTESPEAAWIIDGLKVESLSAATELVEGSVLSIGTEDEHFEGVWRALYSPLDRE